MAGMTSAESKKRKPDTAPDDPSRVEKKAKKLDERTRSAEAQVYELEWELEQAREKIAKLEKELKTPKPDAIWWLRVHWEGADDPVPTPIAGEEAARHFFVSACRSASKEEDSEPDVTVTLFCCEKPLFPGVWTSGAMMVSYVNDKTVWTTGSEVPKCPPTCSECKKKNPAPVLKVGSYGMSFGLG
jgi:hypothetical protein